MNIYSIRDKEMTMTNGTARKSLIKLICFDLDGVYFDGDFHNDFLDPVNRRTGANIEIGNDQKIVLDKDLNLGNISIVQWVEKNIGYELANDDRTFIINKWKSVWKPDAKMKELAERLNNEGFATGVFSNVDSLNGEMYKEKGYFSLFPAEYQFLSYELKMTKPDTKFYEEMLKKSNCQRLKF